jgi:hypothetical protein
VSQKPILKKPSIFHIKIFVPTNTYKFLKNDRNLLKTQTNKIFQTAYLALCIQPQLLEA